MVVLCHTKAEKEIVARVMETFFGEGESTSERQVDLTNFIMEFTAANKNAATRIWYELSKLAKRIREDIAHYATKKVWGENYDSSYREHQLMLRKIEDLRDQFGRALMQAKGKPGDGKRALMFVGVSKNGVREYKSDFPKNMSPAKRVEEFKKRIQSVVNLGQVKLQTDTKKFVVVADKFTKTKNIFGDDESTGFEIETKINALYDIVDMLNSSTYINKNTEDSYDPVTNAPRGDVPPKNKAHEGVKYWYWFKNTIKFDGQLYDVIFNIRDKGREQILYLAKFTALEDNTQKNRHPRATLRPIMVSGPKSLGHRLIKVYHQQRQKAINKL